MVDDRIDALYIVDYKEIGNGLLVVGALLHSYIPATRMHRTEGRMYALMDVENMGSLSTYEVVKSSGDYQTANFDCLKFLESVGEWNKKNRLLDVAYIKGGTDVVEE